MKAYSYFAEIKTYSMVLLALLVLTGITVAAAGINFGAPSVNVVVALVIASIKASLVALFFMHIRHEKSLNAIIFVTALVMLAIFLILSMIDVDTRTLVRPADLRSPPKAAQANQD